MNTEHLFQAFQLMLLGMSGIFLVLGILYGAAEFLIKTFPTDKQ